jgi:multidrug efflux system membrane fusion protein
VFLVNPDSTATVRNITVGTSDGGETEITSGLAPGDEVVMTGVDKLQEGSKVSVSVQGEQPGGRGGASKKGGGKKQ